MIADAEIAQFTKATPGASDTDVTAWLAERRGGITATEVRDLWLGKISARQLAEEKLGRRPRRGGGNAYSAWGRRREPIIAEIIRQAYEVTPESRVWHAADEPRFLASPDGIGIGFDGLTIAEIKTGTDGDGNADTALDEKGYRAQIAWQLRVLDAEVCVYAYEGRNGTPGAFTTGALEVQQLRREELEPLIADLEDLAVSFLAVYDEIADEPFDGPVIDEEIDTHAVNYLAAAEAEKEAAAAKKAAYDAILARMDDDFVQTSPLARVSYTAPKTKHGVTPDEDAAREFAPDAWTEYEQARATWEAIAAGFTKTTTTETKATLRVTAGSPN